ACPLGIKDLAATGRERRSARICFHRIANSDKSFIFSQTRQLPWDATCLGVKRDAQAPHHIGATCPLEAVLPRDLDRDASGRGECFKVVMEVKRLTLKARRPTRWQVHEA